MNDIERRLWQEVKVIVKNPKLRLKDIREWTSGKPKQLEGETVIKVNAYQMEWSVVILSDLDKREESQT